MLVPRGARGPERLADIEGPEKGQAGAPFRTRRFEGFKAGVEGRAGRGHVVDDENVETPKVDAASRFERISQIGKAVGQPETALRSGRSAAPKESSVQGRKSPAEAGARVVKHPLGEQMGLVVAANPATRHMQGNRANDVPGASRGALVQDGGFGQQSPERASEGGISLKLEATKRSSQRAVVGILRVRATDPTFGLRERGVVDLASGTQVGATAST